MLKKRWKDLLKSALVVGVALALLTTAEACPTCKESLGNNNTHLVRGFGWSIMFMMSAPFLILAGLGGYFYYEIRKARANGEWNTPRIPDSI